MSLASKKSPWSTKEQSEGFPLKQWMPNKITWGADTWTLFSETMIYWLKVGPAHQAFGEKAPGDSVEQ